MYVKGIVQGMRAKEEAVKMVSSVTKSAAGKGAGKGGHGHGRARAGK